MTCPRCQAKEKHVRTEYEGRESGELVWTVFYCQRCCFTWRNTEPAESIQHDLREEWFRVDPDSPEKYRQNIPPAKTSGA